MGRDEENPGAMANLWPAQLPVFVRLCGAVRRIRTVGAAVLSGVARHLGLPTTGSSMR
jgi:isopenicillin N synthase-like dioxygenase